MQTNQFARCDVVRCMPRIATYNTPYATCNIHVQLANTGWFTQRTRTAGPWCLRRPQRRTPTSSARAIGSARTSRSGRYRYPCGFVRARARARLQTCHVRSVRSAAALPPFTLQRCSRAAAPQVLHAFSRSTSASVGAACVLSAGLPCRAVLVPFEHSGVVRNGPTRPKQDFAGTSHAGPAPSWRTLKGRPSRACSTAVAGSAANARKHGTVQHVATQDNKRGLPREGSAFGGSIQQAAASNAANAGRAACVQGATQPSGATGRASRHAVWIQMSSRARHGGSWPAHIHTHAHMHTHTHAHTHTYTLTLTHAPTHTLTHTHTHMYCGAGLLRRTHRAGSRSIRRRAPLIEPRPALPAGACTHGYSNNPTPTH